MIHFPPWRASGIELVLLVLIVTATVLLLMALLLATYATVLRHRNEMKAARLTELEGRWGVLLHACLVGRYPHKVFQGKVADRDRLHFARTVVQYSERLSGSARATLHALVEPHLGYLARTSRRANAEDRALVLQVLGTLGLPENEDLLIRGLDDPSSLVSMVAARTLARSGGSRYSGPILERLGRYRNWSRSYLAAMLASMGPDAAEPLRALLDDPGAPPWKRTVAADALRWLNDLPSRAIARRVVMEEGDRDLVAETLRLLSRLGDPEDVAPIASLLTSPDFVIRANAIRALGELKVPVAAGRLESAVTDDESSWVASHAARTLAELGFHRSLRDLARSGHPRAGIAGQVLRERGWAQ